MDVSVTRPEDGICPSQVASILSSECLGPPHSFDLFRPAPIPQLPDLRSRPPDLVAASPRSPLGRFFGTARSRQADAARHNAILRRAHELESRTRNVIQREFEQQFQSKDAELKVLRQRCLKGNVDSIRLLMLRTHLGITFRKHCFDLFNSILMGRRVSHFARQRYPILLTFRSSARGAIQEIGFRSLTQNGSVYATRSSTRFVYVPLT